MKSTYLLRARTDWEKRKIRRVGRAGFEPATFRLSVERSSRAELPAPFSCDTQVNIKLVNKNFLKAQIACQERARSLARIKVSAFGAEDRGFKSHRARHSNFKKSRCIKRNTVLSNRQSCSL